MLRVATRRSWLLLLFCLLLVPACSGSPEKFSGERVLTFAGELPEEDEDFFFLAFDVPDGVREIEIRHDDLSEENILDWGLDDPGGFRGWGGGKSEPAIIGDRAASTSYLPGPIPPGRWEVVIGKAKIEKLPARYEVEVILRSEPTLSPQQERRPYAEIPAIENTQRWYRGDLHVHTLESDGSQSVRTVIEFAHSRGLDFLMLSEHNTTSQLSWYGTFQDEFPDMLLIPGNEFTSYDGHAGVIGSTDWINHRIGTRGATVEDAIQASRESGGFFALNHPDLFVGDLCIGCGWGYDVDPGLIDGVEIRSAVFSAIPTWEELLATGSRAVALGGSDDHHGGTSTSPIVTPVGTPTTWILADELSVPALMRGIRAGRTVVQFGGPGTPMVTFDIEGEREDDSVRATGTRLHAEATGARGTVLEIIRNGVVFDQVAVDADPFRHEIVLSAPASGEDRYRVQLVDATDRSPITVASHTFLRR